MKMCFTEKMDKTLICRPRLANYFVVLQVVSKP